MKKILLLGIMAFVITFSSNAQKIVVDLSRQYLTAYNSDGTIFHECNCVTGSSANTPTGSWYIFEKDKNYESTEFNGAPMPYAMKFGPNGQAIHKSTYVGAGIRSYTKWLTSWYGEHGLAGTHGCVGVRDDSASKLYNWVELNITKVVIKE